MQRAEELEPVVELMNCDRFSLLMKIRGHAAGVDFSRNSHDQIRQRITIQVTKCGNIGMVIFASAARVVLAIEFSHCHRVRTDGSGHMGIHIRKGIRVIGRRHMQCELRHL